MYRRSSSTRLRSLRLVSLALVALDLLPGLALAQTPPPPAPPAAPAPAAAPPAAAAAPTPKALLAAGDKAAKAKDWATALTQYQAALNASPSAQAQEGVASAQYNLKNLGAAYEAYDAYLKTYGTKVGTHAKAQAEARLKELGPQTGYVSIRVNESGADVSIDGKSVGPSPVAALIRVTAGPHKIDVTKDGFGPISQTPNVGANGKEIVDVQLAHEATTGHISVKETSGAAVRVIVDGADVGAAPLDLEVQPGAHEVAVRSANMASPSQQVTVDRGKVMEVVLTAVAASAHLEITTSDRQGIIFLDGKPVAEGAYAGDIGVGAHTVSVKRDGFEPFEKTITLTDKQNAAETVTLRHVQSVQTGQVDEERPLTGIYGGVAVMGLIESGGESSELETSCSQTLGATSCSTPPPLGGGLMGWVGYSWNPVGIEGFLAGEFDEAIPSATFTNAATATTNPSVVGVPRVEQYAIFRGGGMAAARVRLSGQWDRVRLSGAAGFGISIKEMELIRRTEANSTAYSDFSGGFSGYVSPALSLDGSLAVRLSQSLALAFGVLGWLETAENAVQSPLNTKQYLVANPPVPLATPAYHYAQGTQVFLGPYIGLQFGP